MASRLTPFQRQFLEAFFAKEQRFYLTGGGALAGFHLGHRSTDDLDLFAGTNVLDEGELTLQTAASELGGTTERIRAWPSYRRWLVTRAGEALVVDLVVESVHQGSPEKTRVGRIRVDPPDEIFANKLCALLSRAEIRDLIDVLFLLRAGCSLEDGLALARQKDGAVSAAQLGWILGQICVGDDAHLPADVTVDELRLFVVDLRARLAALAFPERA